MYLALLLFVIYKNGFNINIIKNLFMGNLTIIYIGIMY